MNNADARQPLGIGYIRVDFRGSLAAASAMIFALALGFGWAMRALPAAPHPIGALGKRLALAGMSLAAGVAVFNLITRASHAPFIQSPGVWLLLRRR